MIALTRIEQTAGGLLLLIGVVLGLLKIGQIRTLVDQSRARNRDGSLPRLTTAERFVLAEYLAHQGGRYFWHIVVAGILFVGLMFLALRVTGMIPVQSWRNRSR